jgi:glycosyltransferase involved in cell wall biosynthesis
MSVVPESDPGRLVMSDPLAVRISLIIAVYNRAEALRLVLAACARQSFDNFEILIADDGSGPAVRQEIDRARERFSFPITHLWHEDRGWRKNVALNNAIRASRGEQLVFIDGDCLPSREFLRDHDAEGVEGAVLLGRRVEMSARWSAMLSEEMVATGAFERYRWPELLDGLRGDALRLEDGIRIPSRLLRRVLLRRVRTMLGSNFSAMKRDLLAVNGFDELYEGPGCGEDSDLFFRLTVAGIRGKSLRNLGILYHLYHPLTSVSAASLERYEHIRHSGEAWCPSGLERAP